MPEQAQIRLLHNGIPPNITWFLAWFWLAVCHGCCITFVAPSAGRPALVVTVPRPAACFSAGDHAFVAAQAGLPAAHRQ
eukprot:177405-Chlamydomonas_euryale.AAC.1